MTPRKRILFAFSLFLVSTFFLASRHENLKELAAAKLSAPKGSTTSYSLQNEHCKEDLGWLDTYNLRSPFRYASRRISANYVSDIDHEPFTLVETPLFPPLQEIDLAKDRSRISKRCDNPIILDVLAPQEPANASHIIFGIQTEIQRLSDTIIHLARWLAHTDAHLYAIVIETEGVPASDEQMRDVESRLYAEGISATLLRPETPADTFAQRYFSLINITHGYRTPETEWIVLMDDDTFIPSMPALLKTLSEFDSSKPQYVGSLSEDWWAVNEYGLMGFGGAGIFLSVPLTSLITKEKTYKACKDDLYSTAGDVTTMRCIYSHTPYKLSHVPALHQLDIHGDVSGVFESGRPMLTLHHWKGYFGHSLEIEKMHLISDLCDAADCFLRRWQFEDKFVLTNGYSLNQYPEGETIEVGKAKTWFWGKKEEEIETDDEENQPLHVQSYIGPLDLTAIERTWDDNDEMNVKHSFEPTRPGLELGKEKLAHHLIDAVRTGDGIRQVYFRDGGEEDLDAVLVLYWDRGLGEVDSDKAFE